MHVHGATVFVESRLYADRLCFFTTKSLEYNVMLSEYSLPIKMIKSCSKTRYCLFVN